MSSTVHSSPVVKLVWGEQDARGAFDATCRVAGRPPSPRASQGVARAEGENPDDRPAPNGKGNWSVPSDALLSLSLLFSLTPSLTHPSIDLSIQPRKKSASIHSRANNNTIDHNQWGRAWQSISIVFCNPCVLQRSAADHRTTWSSLIFSIPPCLQAVSCRTL